MPACPPGPAVWLFAAAEDGKSSHGGQKDEVSVQHTRKHRQFRLAERVRLRQGANVSPSNHLIRQAKAPIAARMNRKPGRAVIIEARTSLVTAKSWRGVVLGTLVALLSVVALGPGPVRAQPQSVVDSFTVRLAPAERKAFEEWLSAQAFHDFALSTYWRQITDKRSLRRAKRRKSQPLLAEDYVATFPPEYKGPELPAPLAKAWAEHKAAAESAGQSKPPTPDRPILTVDDALASAKKYYGFVPARIPEKEFKRRYAREALTLGLTKDQVVRIYALETGGNGTADMQAGIHPITRKGRAISTALGYAQLLHANSVDEISRSGARFLERLKTMAAAPGTSQARRAELTAKHAALKRMVASARSVRPNWDAHVAYAGTPKGIGIHAVNIDGDIGPWLQVVKLHGLKEMAEKAGIPRLNGAEMELMNLAGPGTGLEMMRGEALRAPTPNFFSRAGYYRNSIVRGRTSTELMAALAKRMDENIRQPGSVEFAAVFDELLAVRRSDR